MNEIGKLVTTELFAAILRGDAIDGDAIARVDAATFSERAEQHGVLPLIADRWRQREDIPPQLQARLRERAAKAAAADLLAEVESKRLVAALGAARIGVLLIKGSHLAYSHYPRPDLRPRIDTDILVPTEARGVVQDLLERLGYERGNTVPGELITGQTFHVARRDGVGVHSVDVHWKVVSRLAFSHLFSFEDLAARAAPIPALGPSALGPCAVDALLIACVHRVAHHFDRVCLIWLYDIHLIAQRLDTAGWDDFLERAARGRIAAVCLRGIERAADLFDTPIPTGIRSALRQAAARAPEPTAAFLTQRPFAEAVVDDLRSLPNWRARWRLVREHLFPAPAYMRRAYANASAVPLPALYALRILQGAKKWLTRDESDRAGR